MLTNYRFQFEGNRSERIPKIQFFIKRILPWLISLFLLLWIWRQIPWAMVGSIFRSISFVGLIGLIVLDVIIVLSMSGRWWVILVGLGIHLNYFQACKFRLAATAVSYFTPGPQFGGEPLQVWVLTHYKNVDSETAVASVTVDKLMELVANFAILIFGILVILQSRFVVNDSFNITLFITAFLGMLLIILLLALIFGWSPFSTLILFISKLSYFLNALKLRKWLIKFHITIKGSEQKVVQLRQNSPNQLINAWLITIFNWILWFGEFWIVYALLGLSMNWSELFIALTTARIAFLLPSPTGLGTFELSQYLAMSAIGHPVSIGISATLLMRVRDTLLAGLGLWFARHLIADG